jgi:hypothetical protein
MVHVLESQCVIGRADEAAIDQLFERLTHFFIPDSELHIILLY